MNSDLQWIVDLLRQEDVEGLIAIGAPSDEYDSEAKAIMAALENIPNPQASQSSLAAIIATVWTESFGRTEEEIKLRMPTFLSIANQLISKA